MPTFTTRRQLQKAALSDQSNVRIAQGALADQLDNIQVDLAGLQSAIPAIGAGVGQMSSEDDGTTYYATDTRRRWRYRHGVGWLPFQGVQRGALFIATEEVRTNTAYGLMTTADRIQGLVVANDGDLIYVRYHASWKNSVAGAGRAAIFIGNNQLQGPDKSSAVPVVQEALGNNDTADRYNLLGTIGGGLHAARRFTNSIETAYPAYTGDVTTGQVMGGGPGNYEYAYNDVPNTGGQNQVVQYGQHAEAVAIRVAPGTYDISIQFKATSGSVSVKDRKLWVKVRDY